MIHAFIGTKAQFIKTAPVLRELQKRGIEYNLIDSGQHRETTRRIRELFGISAPDVILGPNSGNITTILQAVIWTFRLIFLGLFRRGKVWKEVFLGRPGLCIIHGDTLSTLLALFMAKRVGIEVAHIEAGLRSFNYMNPFPEELIRIIVMRFSDLLFAPSDWAYNNLRRMGLNGKIIHTHGNTVYDALRFALIQDCRIDVPEQPYVVLTAHRLENIRSKTRMRFILDTAREVSKMLKVVFVLHQPTEKSLEKYGLLDGFREVCAMMPMQEYFDFLMLLKNSSFTMTDGGSIQEECCYLGIPCLLLRMKTERDEGLGQNVHISQFNVEIVDQFLGKYKDSGFERVTYQKNQSDRVISHSPSKIIATVLIDIDNSGHRKKMNGRGGKLT